MIRPVRIGIAFKLFCALLGAGIVMAAAMGVASRISFERGFLGYLNELETQRLSVLTTTLAELYRDRVADGHASADAWSFLRGEEDDWRRIVRASDRIFRASRDAEGRPEQAPRAAPQAPAAPGSAAAPATPAAPAAAVLAAPAAIAAAAIAAADPPARVARPAGEQAGAEPRDGPARGEPSRRTTLMDAARNVVAGNPRPTADAAVGAVVVSGQTVGWVASAPFRELSNAADLNFQQRQTSAAWFIAGLAVLLAGLTAWGLGHVFLGPARRLAFAIHQLAAGRYDTRVAVTSSDELGRLSVDFNRLARTLEHNQQLRREFMADVSHELRTPLAIMRGELEAMEDGLQALDRSSIQSLQSEVAGLSKLVDDIHQLSIADVGSLSYQRIPCDVADLLEQSLDAFRDRLQAEGMQAILERAPQPQAVVGDPARLTQVFHNILENAVRYAGRGARLRVSCGPSAADVQIVFHDSGPGVPQEYLGKVFDRFYRLEGSRNRATGGSGLGLAICQSIVTAHDGTLVAGRSPQGGLSLTLRLPAAPTPVQRNS